MREDSSLGTERDLVFYIAACTLQEAYRRFAARKSARQWRAQQVLVNSLAADTIQEAARGRLRRVRSREALHEAKLVRDMAATTIQQAAKSMHRSQTFRVERAHAMEVIRMACTTIQAVVRGFLARRRARAQGQPLVAQSPIAKAIAREMASATLSPPALVAAPRHEPTPPPQCENSDVSVEEEDMHGEESDDEDENEAQASRQQSNRHTRPPKGLKRTAHRHHPKKPKKPVRPKQGQRSVRSSSRDDDDEKEEAKEKAEVGGRKTKNARRTQPAGKPREYVPGHVLLQARAAATERICCNVWVTTSELRTVLEALNLPLVPQAADESRSVASRGSRGSASSAAELRHKIDLTSTDATHYSLLDCADATGLLASEHEHDDAPAALLTRKCAKSARRQLLALIRHESNTSSVSPSTFLCQHERPQTWPSRVVKQYLLAASIPLDRIKLKGLLDVEQVLDCTDSSARHWFGIGPTLLRKRLLYFSCMCRYVDSWFEHGDELEAEDAQPARGATLRRATSLASSAVSLTATLPPTKPGHVAPTELGAVRRGDQVELADFARLLPPMLSLLKRVQRDDGQALIVMEDDVAPDSARWRDEEAVEQQCRELSRRKAVVLAVDSTELVAYVLLLPPDIVDTETAISLSDAVKQWYRARVRNFNRTRQLERQHRKQFRQHDSKGWRRGAVGTRQNTEQANSAAHVARDLLGALSAATEFSSLIPAASSSAAPVASTSEIWCVPLLVTRKLRLQPPRRVIARTHSQALLEQQQQQQQRFDLKMGALVQLAGWQELDTACQRLEWYDRPAEDLLRQLAGERAHIISTAEVRSSGRVGVRTVDDGIVEAVPVEAVQFLAPETPQVPAPQPPSFTEVAMTATALARRRNSKTDRGSRTSSSTALSRRIRQTHSRASSAGGSNSNNHHNHKSKTAALQRARRAALGSKSEKESHSRMKRARRRVGRESSAARADGRNTGRLLSKQQRRAALRRGQERRRRAATAPERTARSPDPVLEDGDGDDHADLGDIAHLDALDADLERGYGNEQSELCIDEAEDRQQQPQQQPLQDRTRRCTSSDIPALATGGRVAQLRPSSTLTVASPATASSPGMSASSSAVTTRVHQAPPAAVAAAAVTAPAPAQPDDTFGDMDMPPDAMLMCETSGPGDEALPPPYSSAPSTTPTPAGAGVLPQPYRQFRSGPDPSMSEIAEVDDEEAQSRVQDEKLFQPRSSASRHSRPASAAPKAFKLDLEGDSGGADLSTVGAWSAPPRRPAGTKQRPRSAGAAHSKSAHASQPQQQHDGSSSKSNNGVTVQTLQWDGSSTRERGRERSNSRQRPQSAGPRASRKRSSRQTDRRPPQQRPTEKSPTSQPKPDVRASFEKVADYKESLTSQLRREAAEIREAARLRAREEFVWSELDRSMQEGQGHWLDEDGEHNQTEQRFHLEEKWDDGGDDQQVRSSKSPQHSARQSRSIFAGGGGGGGALYEEGEGKYGGQHDHQQFSINAAHRRAAGYRQAREKHAEAVAAHAYEMSYAEDSAPASALDLSLKGHNAQQAGRGVGGGEDDADDDDADEVVHQVSPPRRVRKRSPRSSPPAGSEDDAAATTGAQEEVRNSSHFEQRWRARLARDGRSKDTDRGGDESAEDDDDDGNADPESESKAETASGAGRQKPRTMADFDVPLQRRIVGAQRRLRASEHKLRRQLESVGVQWSRPDADGDGNNNVG